jgi:flagellar protein FliS
MTHQEIGSTYRETGAAGANQFELVAMLYDVLLDDLRRAIQAIRAGNVEARSFELQHALRVLEQLQGSLNMEQGNEVAANLDRLYSIVRAKILEAQWKVSGGILESQIKLLEPVRDAWKQASQQSRRQVPPNVTIPLDAAAPTIELRT